MIMTLPDGTVKRMDASEAARHCTTEIHGADVRQVFNKYVFHRSLFRLSCDSRFDEDGSGCIDPMEVFLLTCRPMPSILSLGPVHLL